MANGFGLPDLSVDNSGRVRRGGRARIGTDGMGGTPFGFRARALQPTAR